MSQESIDRELLASALADTAGAAGGEHPSIERLSEYLEGALDGQTEGALNDHLVACRRCARELLDLKAFLEDPSLPEGGDGDFRRAAAWRQVRDRVGAGEPRASPSPFRRLLAPLAAGLLLPVLGLSLWILQLRGEVSRLSSANSVLHRELREWRPPEADRWVVPLRLAVRSPSPEEPVDIEVPAGHRSLVVSFFVPEGDWEGGFEVELRGPEGREIWSRKDLPRTGSGTLEVPFSRPVDGDGEYRIRCAGVLGGEAHTLVDRKIRIRWR